MSASGAKLLSTNEFSGHPVVMANSIAVNLGQATISVQVKHICGAFISRDLTVYNYTEYSCNFCCPSKCVSLLRQDYKLPEKERLYGTRCWI